MEGQIQNYWKSYEQLCGLETAKDKLIENLLNDIQGLNHSYQQAKLDNERETQFNRDFQREKMKLLKDIEYFRGQTERASFVLVLIDGDGMIFEDGLIQKGEIGGQEAAGHLWKAVRESVRDSFPDVNAEYKIVVRVYANLKALGETCRRASIIEDASQLEDFARGFTGNKQLFDFIDVGSGKDRADEKITATLTLNLSNVHCRRIYFGCSHDNGYARLFEDIADDPGFTKITPLEGVPYERELLPWVARLNSVKFENLFRTSKINVYQHPSYSTQHYTAMNGTNGGPVDVGGLPHSALGYSVPLDRTTTSSSSESYPTNGQSASWATKAKSSAELPLTSPPVQPSEPPTVPRNKYGQRIDPILRVDASEFRRVQQYKMCNTHYIRKNCSYGDDCTHDHSRKPSKGDLEILKQVARSVPCYYGTACEDSSCIYGHICPQQIEGQKACKYGTKCKFPVEMHGIDMKPVRLTKV